MVDSAATYRTKTVNIHNTYILQLLQLYASGWARFS